MCAPRLMHASLKLLACCHEGTLMFNLCPPRGFFQRCIPAGWPSTLSLGLSLLKGRTLPFFLELQETPAGSFLQAEALPNCSTTIRCISHLISLVLSTNCPFSQVTNAGGEVTGFQLDFVSPVTIHGAWQFSQFLPHLTIHSLGLYFTSLPRRMLWESVEIKSINTHCSLFIYQACCWSFTHIKTVTR